MNYPQVSRELVLALRAAENAAPARDLPCSCEYVDNGLGLMKVAEDPGCPHCTEFGYAWWAVTNGTEPEREAARAYLNELAAVVVSEP